MSKIWRNRLIASLSGGSTRTFEEVPQIWKADVKALLLQDVANGVITPEQYQQLVGEEYVAPVEVVDGGVE